MNGTSHDADADPERQRAVEDIRREVAADHYQRTRSGMLRELADAMRAEVAASPGVIRLDVTFRCHLCGTPVGIAAQSPSNPRLFLCPDCRGKFKRK